MTGREKNRQEWAGRVANYKTSGLTMKAWCAANHCSVSQLKYWLRQMKKGVIQTDPSPPFVPLTITDPPETSAPSLVVRIGQATIEVHSGFDPQLLRQVVHTLESPC